MKTSLSVHRPIRLLSYIVWNIFSMKSPRQWALSYSLCVKFFYCLLYRNLVSEGHSRQRVLIQLIVFLSVVITLLSAFTFVRVLYRLFLFVLYDVVTSVVTYTISVITLAETLVAFALPVPRNI